MPRVIHPCSADDTPRGRMAASMRRSTVQATRRANRRRALPRWVGPALRIGLKLSPVVAFLGFSAWAWTSGTAGTAWENATDRFHASTARAGLAVNEVLLKGRKEADREKILAALGVERGTPILAFDPHAARVALEAMPWVAAASVERRLPDTIFISIVERAPMALWQHDHTLRLVDAEGTVLSETGLERWRDLPLLVGADAPKRGKELLALLAAEPLIGERVEAAILVGGRRWDLKLDNGVDVRLPEKDVAAALRQLATVQQTNKVLERDIVAVDLRVPDRLTVQTSAASADQRRAPQKKI